MSGKVVVLGKEGAEGGCSDGEDADIGEGDGDDGGSGKGRVSGAES